MRAPAGVTVSSAARRIRRPRRRKRSVRAPPSGRTNAHLPVPGPPGDQNAHAGENFQAVHEKAPLRDKKRRSRFAWKATVLGHTPSLHGAPFWPGSQWVAGGSAQNQETADHDRRDPPDRTSRDRGIGHRIPPTRHRSLLRERRKPSVVQSLAAASPAASSSSRQSFGSRLAPARRRPRAHSQRRSSGSAWTTWTSI